MIKDWPAVPPPSTDPVEGALRPLFVRALAEVRHAVLGRTDGDWSVLCGFLPQATFSVKSVKDPGEDPYTHFSYYVPALVGEIISCREDAFLLNSEAAIIRAISDIERIGFFGPPELAKVLRSCFRSLLHDGITEEMIRLMTQDAVAHSVMTT